MPDPMPAILIPPPDMPGYDELPWEEGWTDEQVAAARAELPAQFHIPVWDATSSTPTFLCAVCWGDGWNSQWPCESALKHGDSVFASDRVIEKIAHQIRSMALSQQGEPPMPEHDCPVYAAIGNDRFPCRSHEGKKPAHHFAAHWPPCEAPFCKLPPGHRTLHDIPAGKAQIVAPLTGGTVHA